MSIICYQIYVHVVFSVQGRATSIDPFWKESLYQCISEIITKKNQKLIVINGMPDHLHIILDLNPDCVLSDLVRDIKTKSSKWINDNQKVLGKFKWQRGFEAFSTDQSEIRSLVNYILNQEEYHAKKTFKEEYIELLSPPQMEHSSGYEFEDFCLDSEKLNDKIDDCP